LPREPFKHGEHDQYEKGRVFHNSFLVPIFSAHVIKIIERGHVDAGPKFINVGVINYERNFTDSFDVRMVYS